MDQGSEHPAATSSPDSLRSQKAFKRKFDVALHALDDAIRSDAGDTVATPSPKKARLTRSIYSTLSKYGIKAKEPPTPANTANQEAVVKAAPHLAAILRRTASKRPNRTPSRSSGSVITVHPSSLSSTAHYRPSSITSFLSRLSTFKLSTYSNKPAVIDAVAAAKCGWINDGKDRLVCGICNVSWVLAGREGMSRDAANSLIEKQRASLVDIHKVGCPWKVQQCDSDIYRMPLKPPASLARDIKERAIALNNVMDGIDIRHPLTSVEFQALHSTCSEISLASVDVDNSEDNTQTGGDISSSTRAELLPEPSEKALVTSLFGWSLVPPALSSVSRTANEASTRANSVAPTSVPSSPAHAKGAQQSAGSVSRPTISRLALSVPELLMKGIDQDTHLLQCTLCQRRIGLWAFQHTQPEHATSAGVSIALSTGIPSRVRAQRQFDLLKEHRSYCPYVVRSTEVPSLSAPVPGSAPTANHARSPSNTSLLSQNGNVMEGWKAVLTVVLRTSLRRKQRRRLERSRSARIVSGSDRAQGVNESRVAESEPMELDGIDAMVEGVKARGGRDLLKYIKGLLG